MAHRDRKGAMPLPGEEDLGDPPDTVAVGEEAVSIGEW
jgi:hypothetical protein